VREERRGREGGEGGRRGREGREGGKEGRRKHVRVGDGRDQSEPKRHGRARVMRTTAFASSKPTHI
jgi:hypothetical protein